MKKYLLTMLSLCCCLAGNAQEVKKPVQKAESTATITEADRTKVKEDIKRRREQNKAEMEKARKVVKERISTDTLKK